MPTWATIAEAAEHFRCNPKTIRRRIPDGSLHAERFGPRLIRVDIDSFQGRPLQYAGDAA